PKYWPVAMWAARRATRPRVRVAPPSHRPIAAWGLTGGSHTSKCQNASRLVDGGAGLVAGGGGGQRVHQRGHAVDLVLAFALGELDVARGVALGHRVAGHPPQHGVVAVAEPAALH